MKMKMKLLVGIIKALTGANALQEDKIRSLESRYKALTKMAEDVSDSKQMMLNAAERQAAHNEKERDALIEQCNDKEQLINVLEQQVADYLANGKPETAVRPALFKTVEEEQHDEDRQLRSDWIDWEGGDRPVGVRGMVVEIRLRNGEVCEGVAEKFHWFYASFRRDPGSDIVAYRVVEAQS